jgi:cytochrome b
LKAPTAWDLPVRLSHWLLVVGVFASWGTGHYRHLEWHRYSGYVLLGTLLFRLYWGVVGSPNARFRHFVRGPKVVWAYLRTLTQRYSEHSGGHNPLGGWSVLLMLTVLAAQIALGLFSVDVDGDESGPLAQYVSFQTGRSCAHLHHLGVNLLLASILLHLAAIAFYQFYKRQDLVGPMIRSPVPITTAWLRAVLGAGAAAAVAWLVASGF